MDLHRTTTEALNLIREFTEAKLRISGVSLYLDPNTALNCFFESTSYPMTFFRKARIFRKHGVLLKGRLPTISEEQ